MVKVIVNRFAVAKCETGSFSGSESPTLINKSFFETNKRITILHAVSIYPKAPAMVITFIGQTSKHLPQPMHLSFIAE